MQKHLKVIPSLFVAMFLIGSFPKVSPAEDVTEKAAVGIGASAGNLVFGPAKAVSMVIGALSGALSFLVTGGDMEVAGQVWRDTSAGPYYITPELAKKAVGERPLLEEKK